MDKKFKISETKVKEVVKRALPKGATLMGTYDGGFGRIGVVYTRHGGCDLCGASAKVMGLDSSEGKYSAGQVCLQCAAIALGGDASKVATLASKLEILDKPSPFLTLKGVEYTRLSDGEIVHSPASHRVQKDKA